MALRQILRVNLCARTLWSPLSAVRMASGGAGSGAGQGGGTGGSIRDAGGKFGEMEAAREEEYFRKLQAKQLAELKGNLAKKMEEELAWHEAQIKEHQDDIARHKQKLQELNDITKE